MTRCIPKLALTGPILFTICCAEPDPGFQLCSQYFEGVEGEYGGYMIRTQPAEDRDNFFEGRKALADLGTDWLYQDEYLEMHDAGWGDYLVRYTLIMDASASMDMKMMVEKFFCTTTLTDDPVMLERSVYFIPDGDFGEAQPEYEKVLWCGDFIPPCID